MLTVFTSSYNYAKYLPFAIESVLKQTYGDFEYILVNYGSTDDTLKIMETYANRDKRIKILNIPKQKDMWTVANISIKEANGDAWLWCPADDYFEPTLLEEKYNFAQKHPNTCIYNKFITIDSQGKIITKVNVPLRSQEQLEKDMWVTTNLFGFTGLWIPTNIIKKNLFPTHIKYSGEFYWLLDMVSSGIMFKGLDNYLHYKRMFPHNISGKHYDEIMARVPGIREQIRRKHAL